MYLRPEWRAPPRRGGRDSAASRFAGKARRVCGRRAGGGRARGRRAAARAERAAAWAEQAGGGAGGAGARGLIHRTLPPVETAVGAYRRFNLR